MFGNIFQNSLLAFSADTLLYRFIINVTCSTFKRIKCRTKIAYSRNGVLDVDMKNRIAALYVQKRAIYFVKNIQNIIRTIEHTCMYHFQYVLE